MDRRRRKRRAYRGPLSPFEFGVMVLKAYVRRRGTAHVLHTYRDQVFAYNLGYWVAIQRREYKKGCLSPERIAILEALPGWRWVVVPGHDFEAMLQRVKAFVARRGHARIPMGYTVEGVKLGDWVNRRRCEYREGRLSAARRRALETVPAWTWEPHTDRFAHALGILRGFAAREGHVFAKKGHIERGFPLGDWLCSRRMARRQGVLPAEHARRLEAVPRWTWEPRGDQFQRGLGALRHFAARHGHTRVPPHHLEQGFRLGDWVRKRRAVRRKGRLREELAKALEAVRGWTWDSRMKARVR